jgi:hypothetical protein
MKHFKIVVALVVVLLTVGCATTRQVAPFPDQSVKIENPEKARLYVMRPASFGCAVSMEVIDGDRDIGTTGANSFLCWERDPGATTVSSKAENNSTLDLTVEKGMVYYIFQHVRMGLLFARSQLELVSEAEGQKVLQKCQPAGNVSAKTKPQEEMK